MRSIHDNNIYAYTVACDKRQIIVHTEFHDGGAEEYTDVIFNGVVAHHFEDVLAGNILFGIDEVELNHVVRNWSELFASRKAYGWPDDINYRDAEDLVAILRLRGVKGYDIGSSYGLNGWVLATGFHQSERTTRVCTEF